MRRVCVRLCVRAFVCVCVCVREGGGGGGGIHTCSVLTGRYLVSSAAVRRIIHLHTTHTHTHAHTHTHTRTQHICVYTAAEGNREGTTGRELQDRIYMHIQCTMYNTLFPNSDLTGEGEAFSIQCPILTIAHTYTYNVHVHTSSSQVHACIILLNNSWLKTCPIIVMNFCTKDCISTDN